jgi:hypothetical protein
LNFQLNWKEKQKKKGDILAIPLEEEILTERG